MKGELSPCGLSKAVQRTGNGGGGLVHDVRVNLRGLQPFVPEQGLNLAHVVTGFEQVGGKAVAKHMGRHPFADPAIPRR